MIEEIFEKIRPGADIKNSNDIVSEYSLDSFDIAGLIADGTTTIKNADYILRGYEGIVKKLTNVGAKIKLEEEKEQRKQKN